MPGYNQMNRGYNEQSGINWGKVAAYGAAGVATLGAVTMTARKINNSTLATNARGKANAARGKAKRAKDVLMASEAASDVKTGWKAGKDWVMGAQPYSRGKDAARAGWGGIGGWGGLTGGIFAEGGVDHYADMTKVMSMNSAKKAQAGKMDFMNKTRATMQSNGASPDKLKAYDELIGSTKLSHAKRLNQIEHAGSRMFGAGKYAMAGAGWLSAVDEAASMGGSGGLVRAGKAGGRMAMLGAGVAALDFLNPFSPGWND